MYQFFEALIYLESAEFSRRFSRHLCSVGELRVPLQVDPAIRQELHPLIVFELLAHCRQILLLDELGAALALARSHREI